MRQWAARIVLGAAVVFCAASWPASQDPPAAEPRATGLIPLDGAQLEELVASWPRITRIGLNPLGFNRVNAVRAAKAKPPLDPLLVFPLGGELESVRAADLGSIQGVSPNADMASDLPVGVDNSQLRFFPPIRDQGRQGSCASFASTYYQLSYMTAFERDLDIRDPANDTNKYSPKWSYNMLNDGVDFGSSLLENYELLFDHGASTWAELPYDTDFRAWCLDAAVWRNALTVRTKEPQYVYQASTDAGLELAKELLVDGYVLVFGTYIGSWVFTTVSDDPFTAEDDAAVGRSVAFYQDGHAGSHAMTIVGYNDAVWTDINSDGVIDPGEKGAFRIANSWGTGWEEAGFAWLAYDALRTYSAVIGGPYENRVPALQDDLLYVLTARSGYSPLMIGEFTLSHLRRNQLSLSLGVSDIVFSLPSRTWIPAAFQNRGGSLALDGSGIEVPGSFALDFSELLVAGAGPQRYYLGVSDSAFASSATLSAFKIVDLTTDPRAERISATVPQTIDARQGYAYVEYDYGGTAYNHPPALAAPLVYPPTGRTGDTFTFNIGYSDADGDLPTIKDLVIDGVARPMSLSSGQASQGQYSLSIELAAGSHSYAFYFEDSRGESARCPIAGAFDGPAVYAHMVNSLSPPMAMVGDPDLILVVQGSDFVPGAVLTWNGADRPTTFVSASRLESAIPSSDLAVGRDVTIVVRSPSGVASNPVNFSVRNPRPVLASLDPARTVGGEADLALTVHGSGFVRSSVIRWNADNLTTVYVGPTELRTSLTNLELWTGGLFEVTVASPSPGGGTSAKATFSVADFYISAGPSSLSVDPGMSAKYTVAVVPQNGPFNAEISLSCARLPSGCTASFDPASVTPGMTNPTSFLTLRTSGKSSLGSFLAQRGGISGVLGLAAFLALLAGLRVRRNFPAVRPVRPSGRWREAVLWALLAFVAASCGAGGGPAADSTPSGTYRVQVTATSGCLSDSKYVTLVVN